MELRSPASWRGNVRDAVSSLKVYLIIFHNLKNKQGKSNAHTPRLLKLGTDTRFIKPGMTLPRTLNSFNKERINDVIFNIHCAPLLGFKDCREAISRGWGKALITNYKGNMNAAQVTSFRKDRELFKGIKFRSPFLLSVPREIIGRGDQRHKSCQYHI